MGKFRIKDKEAFLNRVFGADSFLEYWPEIMTEGVPLRRIGDYYYIIDDNGKPVSDTAIFNDKEMLYLEEVHTEGLDLLTFDEFMDTFDDDFKQQVDAEYKRLMKVIKNNG